MLKALLFAALLPSYAPCVNCALQGTALLVQATTTTTDASGMWSVNWNTPFNEDTPYINAQPVVNQTAQPFICTVISTTSTNVTGKCWAAVTTTLPSVASSLLGMIVSPMSSAANIQVRVVGRDLTQ